MSTTGTDHDQVAAAGTRPRFSVIIATHQRRDLVVAGLKALAGQIFDGTFEVIVVVDGSTDGTAATVRKLELPYPLRVLEHANAGASRSRNRGAEVARGELLLFLDDDMEGDPNLLAELDASHRAGADVAFGRLPLHPSSPPTLLSEAVGRWADQAAAALARQQQPLGGDQIYSGQISMGREVFAAVGGFDVRFTAGGTYGNEDLDIGYRIVARGFHVAFNPRAVSRQYYSTPAAVNLRQYRHMGLADVAFARKHPELSRHLFETLRNETPEHARLRAPVLRFPRLAGIAVALLRPFVVRRVDGNRRDEWTEWLFFTIRTVEYWRGVHAAGGIPRPQPVRVLCYHAISDLGGDRVLAEYGLPAAVFRRQIRWLLEAGYHFIRPDELMNMLEGRGGVPRRAVLVTFDDGYRDLLTNALPVLQEHGAPAVVFVVTSRIGSTNDWDQAAGARSLQLLGRDELAQLRTAGIEIGAHSRTHAPLPALGAERLEREIAGSVADLEAAGLGPITLFAYPSGEHDEAVRRAARAAGLRAGFTTDPGVARPGDDHYAIRRIEILTSDRGLRFWLKLATSGRVPLSRAGLRAARWRRSERVKRSAP